jgi:hypothetical protein
MNAAMKARASRASKPKLKSLAAAHRSHAHAKVTKVTMDDVQKPLGKPSDYKFGAPETLERMKAKLGF